LNARPESCVLGYELRSSSVFNSALITQNSSLTGLRLRQVAIQLHVPVQIVAPAFRGVPDPDGDGNDRVPTRLHRLPDQFQASLFRRVAALPIIAAPAGSDDIFPGLSPTFV